MRLALFLVALTLAGCVTAPPSETPGSSAAADPATDAPPVGTAGVLHDAAGRAVVNATVARALGGAFPLGARSSEPTIGAGKDGTIYMTANAPSGVTGQSYPTVIATSDKGQTMRNAGPQLPTGDSTHPRSFDPYVVVDEDTGRVFMDDIWPLGCGTLSYTDDGGKSWVTDPASCGNPQINDHQTVGTAKARQLPVSPLYPKIVYRCVNNVAYTGCATSLTGGLTFGPQVVAWSLVRDGCGASTGHLQADHKGRMMLATASCSDGPSVFITEDDGLTWTKHVIAPGGRGEGHDVDLAVDAADNVYAMWTTKGFPYLASSKDGGKTWSDARAVAAPGVTATMFAAVAAGDAGKIAFAYVGSTVPGGYEGKPGGIGGLAGDLQGEPDPKEWANASWNGYIGVITDALDPNATIQSVTINDPVDPLARGLCGRTRCHGMNDFLDITIDKDGRPWAAFVDVCTQKCVSDPTVHFDKAVGTMGALREGPALRGELAALESIAAAPVKTGA